MPIPGDLGFAREAPNHRTESGGSLKSEFTSREIEVLSLMAEGLDNKETAKRLGLSRKTLGIHKMRIHAKIGAARAAGVMRFALTETSFIR